MNTSILSFNICKLDTVWPINKCMQTLQEQSIKTIQNRSQCYKNLTCKVLSCVKVFWKLKSTLRVEKIFAYLLSTISQKEYFQFLVVHTSRKIAYTKMYRGLKN